MEPDPSYLVEIVEGVDDPRCGLCFDTGHANIEKVCEVPTEQWIEAFAPYLKHLHRTQHLVKYHALYQHRFC